MHSLTIQGGPTVTICGVTLDADHAWAELDGWAGLVDPEDWTAYTDADGDGWPAGYGDCDDTDPNVSPCADGSNCATPSAEVDADGHTDAAAGGDDCDDTDAAVHPAATEICDGRDNNCDALVDDADPSLDTSTQAVGHPDGDGDGFGDPNVEVRACELADIYVADATDCDDTDPDAFPGAAEVPNDGVDQDCNGADLLAEPEDTGTKRGDPPCGCASADGSASWTALAMIGVVAGRRRARVGR